MVIKWFWPLVGVGGFLGSVFRYFGQKWIHHIFPSSFPLGTFAVNILGCFLITAVYGLVEKRVAVTEEYRYFLATGFCGGFTTFSTFSYESLTLLKNGSYGLFILYAGGSVFLGIAAAALGIYVTR